MAKLLINLSLAMQKIGHRKIEEAGEHGARAHCKSMHWWIGIALLAAGSTLHVLAIPNADLSLFAANCAFAIVINMAVSLLFLDETFVAKYDLTAVLFMMMGCGIVVFSANKDEVEYSAEQYLGFLTNGAAITYYILSTVCMVASYYVQH